MNPFLAWLILGRPHFLVGGALFFELGAWLAAESGHALGPADHAIGLSFVLFTQWMVHFRNDARDAAADRLNAPSTPFTGGSRMVARGHISVEAAHRTATVLGVLGLIAGAVDVWFRRDPTVAAVEAAAWFLSHAYSGWPYLQERGAGPFVTVAILAGFVPGLALAMGGAPATALLPVVPTAVAAFAVLMTFDLLDLDPDEAAGKRTFAVRIGRTAASVVALSGFLAVAAVSAAFGDLATTSVAAVASVLSWRGVWPWAAFAGLLAVAASAAHAIGLI